MQCHLILLLYNVQKPNKMLLKSFDLGFYENPKDVCMHGSNDHSDDFFFNANNKPVNWKTSYIEKFNCNKKGENVIAG